MALPLSYYKKEAKHRKLNKQFFWCFQDVGVSPSGKASGFGPDILRFESLHPSFLIFKVPFEVFHTVLFVLNILNNTTVHLTETVKAFYFPPTG